MNSITLALRDEHHPVPGIAASLAADLLAMRAAPVHAWIRSRATYGGVIVIADDEWANPCGFETLEIPADQIDVNALNMIKLKVRNG
jgi:hypothetical protein